MMLADRIKRDVFYDDHLIVSFRGNDVQELARIIVQARANLFIHQGDATRRLVDARAVRVLANALEDQTHTFLNFRMIESLALCALDLTLSGVSHRVRLSFSPA